ncbi:MAG: ABC transporter permease [Deferribacteraceae bacterium]|jgi:ABC-type multidrug transport system permease subunit|nr:ABC transporter permease [Deferribacteraceae bacterium]
MFRNIQCRPTQEFNGILGVYYKEMLLLRNRFIRRLLSSMVSPALFLAAFGYGLGRGQSIDGLRYLDYLFAGLLAMSTLNACYGISTEINIARFYFKIFDEYLIAPIPRWHIVAGETFYGITKGAVTVIVFLLFAFIVKINLHITPVFLIFLLAHMTLFSLLGFIVALRAKHHADQFVINTFLITPMTFLSGVFFPLEHGPVVFQWIMQLSPLTHTVALMRSSLTGGLINGVNIVALCVFLILFFGLALRFAKKCEG